VFCSSPTKVSKGYENTLSEMERVKMEILGGKMVKLEKVKYGSEAKTKLWKAGRYWGFEAH
jgi:hypothetical protein